MTDAEIVAACEARGCCPLGAAIGCTIALYPQPWLASQRLSVPISRCDDIADMWDRADYYARKDALANATAAGLRPRIEAFLSGGGKP